MLPQRHPRAPHNATNAALSVDTFPLVYDSGTHKMLGGDAKVDIQSRAGVDQEPGMNDVRRM